MKAGKLREMSTEELQAEELSLSEELFRLRFRKATGQLEKSARIGQVRKDIARVKTIISEKMREAHAGAEG
ncbi:MAG: 50S ribosomal protein L29 [Acidobacteria bacterium]|nr:50S ribosomal protein L29 [Acidobacteriota bacterium]